MNKKFSEYTEDDNKIINNYKSNTQSKSSEDIEKMYNQYSKYSESELMQEFLKMSKLKKQKGELSDSVIDTYRNTLFPYLSDEQKKTFEYLLNVVK